MSTEPEIWFTPTSSENALLLENLQSGVELSYENPRLAPGETYSK
jgi:hypothetical protein